MKIMALEQLELAVIPSIIWTINYLQEASSASSLPPVLLTNIVLHKNLYPLNFQSTLHAAFNLRTIVVKLE